MGRITEKKRVKINQDCPINPVFLTWRNKLGNWDEFVFSGNQRLSLNVTEAVLFERFIDDLGTASTIKDYLSKRCNYEMVLGYENLLVEDIQGIEGMLSSARVRMQVTPQGVFPPVFVTVLIPTGNFTTRETSLNRYFLEFTIKLPETLLQSQ